MALKEEKEMMQIFFRGNKGFTLLKALIIICLILTLFPFVINLFVGININAQKSIALVDEIIQKNNKEVLQIIYE